jgi:hypothetical protein
MYKNILVVGFEGGKLYGKFNEFLLCVIFYASVLKHCYSMFMLSVKFIFQQGLVAHLPTLRMAGMLASATLMDVELHTIVLTGLNWLGGLIDTVRLMVHGVPRSYLPACVSCILNLFQSKEQFYPIYGVGINNIIFE